MIGVFLLPYFQRPWWSFVHSSVCLAALFALAWGRAAFIHMGLPTRPRAVLASLALGLGLWLFFRFVLVPTVLAERGLTLHPWSPWRTAMFVFQALNEEVVLGYVLVMGLVRATGRPVLVVVVVALVFAALHHVMYRVGIFQHALLASTLVTLAGVGIIRNGTIVMAGHIGYAWALHAAWNLIMFSGLWRKTGTERHLTEPETFDAFFSSLWLVVPVTCAAALVLGTLIRRGSRAAPD